MTGYELVVAFDRDEDTFARGVEVGMLHVRLASEPRPLVAMLHASNVEMALRLAESHGASAKSEQNKGEWIEVTFS